MQCVICRVGETSPGTTTVTLEHGNTTLVIKSAPANVCRNCGEGYVDDRTAERLLQIAEEAVEAGVQVDIRQFLAA
ncbi:MAG: type II toxin-antitoxin system MqsA family antitoxin [Ktedonobacteraceae bacterium]